MPFGDLEPGGLSLRRFLTVVPPSDISGPEPAGAAPSPSEAEPAPAVIKLLFLGSGCEEDESLEGSAATFSFMMEDLRWGWEDDVVVAFGADVAALKAGDMGLLPGWGVDVPVPEGCFFLCFLREVSVPLISERSGEPGRLSLFLDLVVLVARGSLCFERPEGVFVPLEEAPEGGALGGFSPRAAFSFARRSCSTRRAAASRARSSSESVEEDCRVLVCYWRGGLVCWGHTESENGL